MREMGKIKKLSRFPGPAQPLGASIPEASELTIEYLAVSNTKGVPFEEGR